MKKKLIYSCISIAVGVVLTLLLALVRGAFKAQTASDAVRLWCDAVFVTAAVLGGFGILILCSNGGTFDMLAFGTKKLFGSIFRSRRQLDGEKAKNFADYRYEKQQNKKSAFHLLVSGAFFFIITIILLIIYLNL